MNKIIKCHTTLISVLSLITEILLFKLPKMFLLSDRFSQIMNKIIKCHTTLISVLSFSLSQFEDYSIWFGVSQYGSSCLKLRPHLSRVPLREGQGEGGQDVGQQQEHLHVSQLGARANSGPSTVGKKA